MNGNDEQPNDGPFLINVYKDVQSYYQDALRSILTATRASCDLPAAGVDFDYYSSFNGFKAFLVREGQSILSLMTCLIQSQGIREKFQGSELEEKFDLLTEVNNVILDNVSTNLDEASGLKKTEEELILAVKPQSSINTSWNKKQFNSNCPQSYKLLTAKNISRPQLAFKDKIDNTNSIFVPIIKEKPNSIKPLAVILEKDGDREEFCHPYELEIEKFEPAEEHLQTVEPELPKPLEETPFIFVKTEEQLKHMCDDLKKSKEFAVDLEHHSYRSFQGFACLMQISTREKDYVIDVLELRGELHILNEVFTNPKIVKVFHGADMDILWLQRDFGLYVVNLFDTGQAARVLHFAHLSLSYLLKHYCKKDLDKKFQLADWRIRPIPPEMLKYAREDTHYLLYIYDCLKNDLITNGNEMKNLLHSTFERSKMICLKRYQKPVFSDDKYLELYKKSKKTFNAKQLYCLKELYGWRDRIARENDESLAYVLPNHMLLQIAEALPREQQGILACCNPIPPLVKQQLNELHSIVLKANESSLKQLEILEFQANSQTPKINNQIDLSSMVHCPHDIHHLEDRKNQSTSHSTSNSEITLPLLRKEHSSSSLLKKRPTLSLLFDIIPKKVQTSDPSVEQSTKKVLEVISNLFSPFKRFQVTEQLQSEQQRTETRQRSETQDKEITVQDQNSSIHEDLNEECTTTKESAEIQEPSVSNEPINESCEILESTPLCKKHKVRKIMSVYGIKEKVVAQKMKQLKQLTLKEMFNKNKKRKKRKADPDISLIDSTESGKPPNKKSCTPEVVVLDDDSFTPYDYSQAEHNSIFGKKNSKEMRQDNQTKFQTPGRNFGKKRKHAKQTFFSRNQEHDAKKNFQKWPKNK